MPLPIPRSKELDHTYSPWNCRVYIIFYDNRITFVSLINPSVVTSNLAFWAFSSLVFAVLMEEVLILAVGISIGLPIGKDKSVSGMEIFLTNPVSFNLLSISLCLVSIYYIEAFIVLSNANIIHLN